MIELSRRAGIIIPKVYEKESWYQVIKSHLFRRQQNYNSPDFTTMKFYLESENYLTIPRFFPIHKYVNEEIKFIDNTHTGEDINIEHTIMPRNNTQILAKDYMVDNDNGMIKLGPGMGKTVISIYMIAIRKKKTLIVVHRDTLDKQWRNRIIEHSNIPVDKIALLNSSKFEEQLAESPIIISTSQTMVSILKRFPREYLIALNKANIGISIFDELHTTVGAPTFSLCSLHAPSKVVFGLSATPYRNDNNTDILKYHLGDLFENDSDDDTMPAEVTFILLDFNIDTKEKFKYMHWEGKFQRSRYLNLMKNSKIFMDLVKSLLLKLSKDRHLLFISERVGKMLVPLFEWLPFEDKSMFVGGSNLKELDKKITFSTPGKIRDGIDCPAKDSLLITSPVKNIEQLSGRITRIHKGHNKKTPIILDMVDIGSKHIKASFWGRLEYYKKKNWKVQYLYINPDTYQKFNLRESDAFTVIKGE